MIKQLKLKLKIAMDAARLYMPSSARAKALRRRGAAIEKQIKQIESGRDTLECGHGQPHTAATPVSCKMASVAPHKKTTGAARQSPSRKSASPRAAAAGFFLCCAVVTGSVSSSAGGFSPQVNSAGSHGKIINIDFSRIIQIESGGNPKARSWCGARGLMQVGEMALDDFNAANGTDYKPDDLYIPDINVAVGVWYFAQIDKWLYQSGMKQNNFNRIIAYNWGIGNLRRWHKEGRVTKRLPIETQVYLRKYFYREEELE
jgi:soluble lytic murein transglycosylase-like protein